MEYWCPDISTWQWIFCLRTLCFKCLKERVADLATKASIYFKMLSSDRNPICRKLHILPNMLSPGNSCMYIAGDNDEKAAACV